MTECIEWTDDLPTLQRPVLLAAFKGWNDAAGAATGAIDWILDHADARRIAAIDPEDFFDFQAHRPRIELTNGDVRTVRWPENAFFTVQGGERDLIVLRGEEPSHRWRTFTRAILDMAERFGCEELVTFGALLADIPHTRTPPVTAVSSDHGLAARLGLDTSRYQGPTGIVGVLHDAAKQRGLRTVSLWVPVSHYLQAPPNPLATRALLDRFGALTGYTVERHDLDDLVAAWSERVGDLVAADDDIRTYIERLEADDELDDSEDFDDFDHYDDDGEVRGLAPSGDGAKPADEVPSGDAIAAELERFLRERGRD